MNRYSLISASSALLLSAGSLPVHASLYDLICVECTLVSATYQVTDPVIGDVGSGNLTVSDPSSGFQIDSFYGFPLVAHDVNTYWGSGTYTFNSIGDSATPGQAISMTVNPGQIGMHFLFDWSIHTDIDVLNVFDVSYSGSDMILTSTDVDGNGRIGFAMVDGPFQGVDMATSFVIATPVPAAAWLFGSGLMGLLGVARRKALAQKGAPQLCWGGRRSLTVAEARKNE